MTATINQNDASKLQRLELIDLVLDQVLGVVVWLRRRICYNG